MDTVNVAAAYAGFTSAMTNNAIQMKVLKNEAESQQAIAGMLMDQSAQISAQGYNNRGQVVPTGGAQSFDMRM